MLKIIFVIFCWFFDKNNKLVFWAENQQKTKKIVFSIFYVRHVESKLFICEINTPHITMTKANFEFKNSLAHELENSKFLDFSDLNVSSVRGILREFLNIAFSAVHHHVCAKLP